MSEANSLRLVLAASAVLLFIGCSQSNADMLNVDENLTTTDMNADYAAQPSGPAEPKPIHLYELRDGEKYGYIAAVSEEDQKRGKAAGDVALFIYRGHDGDTYKIDAVTASGTIVVDYECKRPCNAIKQYSYGGVSYIGFTPDSLIGAAFTDAFNGYLVPAPLPKPQERSTEITTYYQPNDAPDQTNSADSDNAPPANDWSPPASDPIVTNDVLD
jgi:hypothetical protein